VDSRPRTENGGFTAISIVCCLINFTDAMTTISLVLERVLVSQLIFFT
jgi:hypothetical protein